MNFVYLSPHFPPNYEAFCVELREKGVNVLGLAEAPYEALSPRLRSVLTEYYRVDDMHDYDSLVRALGYFTHCYGKIDRVESHAEYWLETEAQLRSDFNIPGIRSLDLLCMKRKSLMKDKFTQAGATVIRGEVALNHDHALKIADEIGFPLVAKPDIGVGAAGTFRFDTSDELSKFYREHSPRNYILEQYIEGTLVSFDGLTDASGEPVFLASHVFSDGIMNIVSKDLDIHYYSMREIPEDLERIGRAVLAAYKPVDRFFHFEFFRRHDNQELVALEVNMRPPGGLTTDMFNYANDINIYRQWARVVVGEGIEPGPMRPYHCCYIGRKDHLHYRHSHEQVMQRAGSMLCHQERVQSVFRGAIGDQGYLVRSPELDEVLALAEFALAE